MGVEPSQLATAINCIVAQRLARKLCLEGLTWMEEMRRVTGDRHS